MKKKTNFIKKVIFSITLVLALVCSSGACLFRTLFAPYSSVYAYSADSSLSFSNSTFTSTSSNTNRPYTANNWTLSGDDHVKKSSGVISVNEDTFSKTNYNLTTNPGRDDSISSDSSDYSIFMFRSTTKGKAELTSSSVTLAKQSFYKISVLVKTMDNGQGSMTAKFGEKEANFIDISTTNGTTSVWRTYNFYVATDEFESVSTTLTLRFGSSANINSKSTGEVFFDNVKITEIGEEDFGNVNTSVTASKTDLRRTALTGINNGNFEEENLTGWVISEDSSTDVLDAKTTNAINALVATSDDKDVASTNVKDNKKSLLLYNGTSSTKTITTASDNTFAIKQFGLYKITFLYKVGNISGTGLTVKIYDSNEDDAETYNASQTLSSSSGLSNYNGFSLATFYVVGDAKADRNLMMEISLKECTGWAIIDDIKMFPIVTSEYSSTNAIDYTSKLSKDSNITNGKFDFVTINSQNESNGDAYPATPTNWTFVGNNNQGGIVRLNPTNFDKDNAIFGYPDNPNYDNSYFTETSGDAYNLNENVLMVRNTSSEEVLYKSSSVTVSANTASSKTYAQISVSVNAKQGKGFIRLVDESGNILGQVENITTSGWKRYNFYIYNSVTEQKVYLQLGAHAKGNFVFFDNVVTNTSLSDTPTTDGKTSILINLLNNDFTNKTGYTGYEKLTDDYRYSYEIVEDKDARPDASDSYALKITNSLSTYQTLVSDYTYSLTAEKYYKFSVWVKTNFDSENNSGDYGANFEIVTLDSDKNIVENEENKNKFVNIVSGTENNGWVEYSIYVLAESTQNVKIRLGVGTLDAQVYGYAYFDDVTVEEIDKADYPTEGNATTIISTIVEPTTDDDDSTDDNTDNTESADINVWLLVSSILLVLALILAIIGYAIRRIPKKKKEVKVDKKKYDKKKDEVDKEAIKKNLKAQKEENLAKLNSEINELQQQYDTLKHEYEEKTKDADVVDQKLFASYTKKANKLIQEIDYLKSAITYLNDSANVNAMEKREIKKSQQELEKKNMELNLTTTVEDVQEEKEEPKKKAKKKLKKFN